MGIKFLSSVLCASLSLTSPTVLAQSLPLPLVSQAASSTIEAQEDSIETISDHAAQWVLALGLLTGAIALSIGIRQYTRNQRWNRIEFLRRSVREFEQDPEIWKALKIMDFEEYRDYEINHMGQRIVFQVDNQLLCDALGSHEERSRRKEEIDKLTAAGNLDPKTAERYLIETELRDWFNKMLNGLEHFGYFIQSGLFTAQEIRPWMIYWIQLIADRSYKRPGASKFYDQLYSYIHNYGFNGVIRLFDSYGYRILPTPYKDKDFANLKGGLKDFDIQTALSLSKAAYLTYQDLAYVTEITQNRWGIDVKNGFYYINSHTHDTQAFMFKTSEYIVLAFRGSQELKDWQTNASTRLRKVVIPRTTMEPLQEDWTPPRGMVHRGFQTAWESVEKRVIQQIHKWNEGRPTPLPLFITGHSLGGALATVAAASLAKRGIERGFSVQGLYTFGQPRVGDLVFASEIGLLLKGKVFRFVNNNDIVPHVPPPYLPWNPFRLYVHLGQMRYFDWRGNLTMHPNPLFRFIDFSFGLLRDVLEPGFDMINDHRMEYYVTNLEKALNAEIERQKLLQDEMF